MDHNDHAERPESYHLAGKIVLGLAIFFPFATLGIELLRSALVAGIIYVAMMAIFVATTWFALQYAPAVRDRRPVAQDTLAEFDPEQHGVPW